MPTIVRRAGERSLLITKAFAVFLALHGIAHFVGTSESLRNATDGTAVDYLGGAWQISSPTLLRTLGVAWAVEGAAFLLTAWAYWIALPRRRALLAFVAFMSLLLSVAAVWQSIVGVVINVVLLVVAGWTGRSRSGLATA
jgi:hypothetical protein